MIILLSLRRRYNNLMKKETNDNNNKWGQNLRKCNALEHAFNEKKNFSMNHFQDLLPSFLHCSVLFSGAHFCLTALCKREKFQI